VKENPLAIKSGDLLAAPQLDKDNKGSNNMKLSITLREQAPLDSSGVAGKHGTVIVEATTYDDAISKAEYEITEMIGAFDLRYIVIGIMEK